MPRRTIVTLVLTVAFVGAACAREQPAPAPSLASPAAAAKELIARTSFATLTTLDEDGAPQSRIVEPFPLEGEFTVWIATNGATRKVRHIERDPRVTVLYFDPSGPGYVSIIGNAAIVRDPAEKARRWKDSWVGFYKDRNRGDDYTLIRVMPTRLEISSPSQKMNNDPVTWQPVTVAIGKD